MLALPAAASAITYSVNSVVDEEDEEPGEGGCKTAKKVCTLRAAIEELNELGGGIIKFNSTLFDGKAAGTITLKGSLPEIEETIHIDGDAKQCATEAGVSGPCVGISGPAAGAALIVEAPEVKIEGLAVTGAKFGIDVNGAEEFEAGDNWFGVKLDGKEGANGIGLFLDTESYEATIGGTESSMRNVFANNQLDGLDLRGAEFAVVRGNYFGVKPDGKTPAPNGKDIEVTDSAGSEASEIEIGATIKGAALTSPGCDGGCNVISGALSAGVDLQGDGAGQKEAPATGMTTVNGNYIGLSAAGTEVVGNGTYGILVGAAGEAEIGGSSGDANYIAGGKYGIYGKEGEVFQASENAIGFNAAGAKVSPPSAVGIFDDSLGVAESTIFGNKIRLEAGGIGIEQLSGGAFIEKNIVKGGLSGILVSGSSGVENSIEGNRVEAASANGIVIESDHNEVLGNEVLASKGAGILVKHAGALPTVSPTTGNFVGGDTSTSENVISGSGGAAIEILDLEKTANVVERNRGSGNAGLFIDLVSTKPGTEPNGPNHGIKPPVISVAKSSEASGSGARPGATVRVFRKATASTGEVASFLGKAVADGSGNWTVPYAAIPAETEIAASQTGVEDGTSELAFAKAESGSKEEGKKEEGKKEEGGGNGGGGGGSSKDETPPETKILKAPKSKTHSRNVMFKFSSSAGGAKFQCSLDGKRFKACGSPKKYKALKPGKHAFKVRAIDGEGKVDPTPAKKSFKILRK